MQYESLMDKVVVITGASSGIGKLAVEEFLKAGANVVLAARSEAEMQAHLMGLQIGLDRALVVKTDVSDNEQVRQLAQEALRHFTKIDIWINNAAVNLYGYVEDTSIADIRRILDVDLMGEIHGMKTALDIFIQQGYGNILNVSSIDGVISPPLQAAYAAAKHGVLGFSCALREELWTERYQHLDIDVVDILPASMDTPLFKHAKSLTGKQPKPFPPVYDPLVTVQALLNHAKDPQPYVVAGSAGKAFTLGKRLMPNVTDRLLSMVGVPGQLSTLDKPADAEDNLYQPVMQPKTIRGGFQKTENQISRFFKHNPMVLTLGLSIPLLLIGRKLRQGPSMPLARSS
jgi:NAD(P)-dependent dehydrogenase (short-subunit alcohol dehydrogenase family)